MKDPAFHERYIALTQSMSSLFAEVIKKLWEEALSKGMTEEILRRRLNWSIHRLRRTMSRPLNCRGGAVSAIRLMVYLGFRGFKEIAFDKAPSFDFNMKASLSMEPVTFLTGTLLNEENALTKFS